MGQIATDLFLRPDQNPIAGNWTNVPPVGNITGAVEILSHQATESGTALFSMALWNANSFPNDQYSEMSFATFGSGGGSNGPSVRTDSSGDGYIGLYGQSVNTLYIDKISGGNAVLLNSVGGITLVSSDILRLEIVGTGLTLKVNGIAKLTASEGSFASGAAGMFFYGAGSPSGAATYWAGGDFSVSSKSTFFIMT